MYQEGHNSRSNIWYSQFVSLVSAALHVTCLNDLSVSHIFFLSLPSLCTIKSIFLHSGLVYVAGILLFLLIECCRIVKGPQWMKQSIDNPWHFEQNEIEKFLLHEVLILPSKFFVIAFLAFRTIGAWTEIWEMVGEHRQGFLSYFRFRLYHDTNEVSW